MDDEINTKTGIYIAYPTSPELKSIYRPKNYKTKVNNQHTKVGIAKDNFNSRKKDYLANFDNEVEFYPIVLVEIEHIDYAESLVISAIKLEFKKVGRAREWFDTSNRQRVSEIILSTLSGSGIECEFVG